jgi:membrane-associated phospholipid phosphatase
MRGSVLKVARMFRAAALCAMVAAAAAGVAAQSSQGDGAQEDKPVPRATPSPTPRPERRFFADIVRDQRAIWTSPFHLGRGDAKWLAPLAVSTVALIASDQETGELSDNRGRISVSKDISLAGSIYSTGGIAAGFYLLGRATGNARARETGLLGGEALINTALVYSVLKNVSQRPRPTQDGAHAEFFDGGHSFPSGHAASAWALATVVANEYHDRRAVQVGAYGLAAAVSISRYTGRNHFLSDILVGSAIGYGIGRYVYKTHHDPALDASGADTGLEDEAGPYGAAGSRAEIRQESARSRLVPLVAPGFSRARREYGLALSWGF